MSNEVCESTVSGFTVEVESHDQGEWTMGSYSTRWA